MATPQWQPGTIYAPGSLVQPASAIAPVPDQVTNGGFESGNTGWSLGSGFSIGQFGRGTHFQGTWSLQWDSTTTGRAINTNATEVVPGQTINGSCQVQQGASSSGQAGARAEIAWYDSSDDLISYSSGNLIDSGSNQNWKQSSVSGVAPAGAAFARFSVYAFRTSGGDELWVDNCTWDAVVSSLPTGLVFRAVQAVAGYSGATEPVWPVVNGATVVDNEVTWEAVFASRVVWEASPILVSGSYEPEWPTVPNGTVADGTIKWVAMPNRVTDPKAPQSKIIEIGASKIFAADDDIIPFSATVNPLDWSSEADAGYIPFGLNTFGSTPVTAMALYRGNLVAFNSEGYQMWQIDQDPANMAILDASPLSCLFFKSPQPVMNDLVMCTPEGVRNIGIAGASTNLQAGFFGAQVDPLVLAAIQSGTVPFALFWPGAGQYWLIFGNEAFVLTMNGGNKDQSWSRYEFPEDLTYWAILDGDLYLRAGSLVWRVSPEALEDDIITLHESAVVTTSGVWTKPADLVSVTVKVVGGGGGGGGGMIYPSAHTAAGGGGAGAKIASQTFLAGDLPDTVTITIGAGGAGAVAKVVNTATDPLIANNGTAGGTTSFGSFLSASGGAAGTGGQIGGGAGASGAGVGGNGGNGTGGGGGGGAAGTGAAVDGSNGVASSYTAGAGGTPTDVDGGAGGDGGNGSAVNNVVGSPGEAGSTPGGGGGGGGGANLTVDGTYTCPVGGDGADGIVILDYVYESGIEFDSDGIATVGTPFEGYIAWPYLDFGILGVDKMMEGFDVTATGEFAVSFGYSQRDFSLATDAYTLDGDTLTGGMVPMPLTAPSFQLRLTFSASQQWEWQASNIYISDLGTG